MKEYDRVIEKLIHIERVLWVVYFLMMVTIGFTLGQLI